MAGADEREDHPTPPTLAAVALHAGVSSATVSRVVAGLPGVGDATRRRVRAAIDELGYVADPLARALAGGSGDEIGLVIVASPAQVREDPHFSRVIAAAVYEATRHGVTIAVHLCTPEGLSSAPPLRGDRRYIGALTVNMTTEMASSLGPDSTYCPVVSLGATTPSIPFVDPDNTGGARAVVEHLLATGRRRIAMIAGPTENACATERLDGYRAAMSDAGLESLVAGSDFTRIGGASATDRLVRVRPDVDGLFVASDLMASGALMTLAGMGRVVPDDVAVVGFDNSLPALTSTPQLSTVNQPVEEIVALAISTLLDAETRPPHEQRVPTTLICRESSAA